MTLCVAGGREARIQSNEQNHLQIDADGRRLTLERDEAQGLVSGLNNSMTAIEANEADRIRDCLQPYRGQIVAMLLHPKTAVLEPRSTPYVPPQNSPSLLAPAFGTNFANEATDYGVRTSQRYLKFQDGGASRCVGYPRMVETRRVWRSE